MVEVIIVFPKKIWVFPKIVGFPPKSSILIGFFPLFSPSILGCFPIFGNIQIYRVLWALSVVAGFFPCNAGQPKKHKRGWTRKRFQAWYRTRWATILPVIHVFCCFSLLYSMLCFLFKIPIQSSSQFCMLLIANMLCLNKWEVLVVTDACRCHGTLFFRFIPYAV